MTSRLIRQPVKLTLLALCAALIITWGVSVETQAQALYGSITGRVVDSTGGAIPGAEVTVLNPATNFTQTTLTNDVGVYSLPNLPDGAYTLTVSLTGFKNAVSEGVRVEAGTLTRENVVLQVGEITESITVSSAATVLKTDTTDVSAQLDAEEIEDLPMGAFRNYQSLVNLVPGATAARFQNAITDTPGRALSTNINGTNRNSNNTRIDGAISVNIWLPHHTAYVPPSETIEVVDISTNNFDAEKGFAGGAATTVITKSGTNDVHGSAWWYHENSALNARDFFNFLDEDGDGKADKPKGRRHMWGGTLGGPIVKDKVFYFVGFEATQQARGTTATSTLPTQAMRNGDFSAFLDDGEIIYDPLTGNPDGSGRTPFEGNIIPQDRMSDASLAMQDLLPLPTYTDRLTSNHEVGGQEVLNRYNTDIKADWYRTDAHRLWGKFSWMDAQVKNNSRFGPAGGGAIGSSGDGVGDTDVKVYGVGQTWTLSPTFLLDTNFGFTDMDQQVLGQDFELGNFGQDVLGIPGTNAVAGQEQACIVDGVNRCGGIPRFSVDGYNSFGQVDGWTPIFRDEDSLTFTQNFSWTKGSHELRFGFDLVRHQMYHWQPEIGAGPRGRFNFSQETTAAEDGGGTDRNAWAAYLLGLNSYAGKGLQWETMTTNEWQSAFYIRDRWQVTPKLTFTLGLRWEYYPLVSRWDRPMEVMPVTSTVPCGDNGSEGPDCFSVILDNNISVSKKLFAPRLGLAYRLSDNDVFRIGYGVTYSPIPFSRPLRGFYPLTIAGDFNANNAFITDLNLDEGVPVFSGPDTAPGSSSPIPSFVDMRTMPVDKINRGYIQSWNVMYERKLPSDVVMSVGYVGTQTTRQLADQMLDWAGPGTTGGTGRNQLYPIRTTNTRYWDGWLSGNYHSLQVAVNRRFTGGLFIKGAYTYGKAINRTDDEGWAGLMWNDPALLDRNRAPAGFSRPHTLQVATVYELPFGADGDDVGSKIVRNWQINGIFSINQNSPNEIGGSSNINTRQNSSTADQIGELNKLGGIGTGDPYYDRSSFRSITDRPGGNIVGETCTNLDCYGNIGRNMIRGPAWVNLDFSVFRDFAITEGTALEFRSEFFNITNTPHFNNPNFSANSSSFMYITGTSDNAPERVIRFALKLKF